MKIVVELHKHKPRMYKGKDMTREMFFFPAIPWKWTLYNGSKVLGFGYTHTEEDANRAANQAINRYSPVRA